MARKRKNVQQPVEEIAHKEEEDIPEDERIRLIQESGVLNFVDQPESKAAEEAVERPSLGDEIFDCIIYLIPFSCLYLGMDIMIKQQYAQHPSFEEEVYLMINTVPILSLLIFYTSRYKNVVLMQLGMFLASIGAGSRMIHLVNNESWNLVIRQCPPLGVIWVYTIVQLQLTYACISLLVVFAYVRYYSLKIIF